MDDRRQTTGFDTSNVRSYGEDVSYYVQTTIRRLSGGVVGVMNGISSAIQGFRETPAPESESSHQVDFSGDQPAQVPLEDIIGIKSSFPKLEDINPPDVAVYRVAKGKEDEKPGIVIDSPKPGKSKAKRGSKRGSTTQLSSQASESKSHDTQDGRKGKRESDLHLFPRSDDKNPFINTPSPRPSDEQKPQSNVTLLTSQPGPMSNKSDASILTDKGTVPFLGMNFPDMEVPATLRMRVALESAAPEVLENNHMYGYLIQSLANAGLNPGQNGAGGRHPTPATKPSLSTHQGWSERTAPPRYSQNFPHQQPSETAIREFNERLRNLVGEFNDRFGTNPPGIGPSQRYVGPQGHDDFTAEINPISGVNNANTNDEQMVVRVKLGEKDNRENEFVRVKLVEKCLTTGEDMINDYEVRRYQERRDCCGNPITVKALCVADENQDKRSIGQIAEPPRKGVSRSKSITKSRSNSMKT